MSTWTEVNMSRNWPTITSPRSTECSDSEWVGPNQTTLLANSEAVNVPRNATQNAHLRSHFNKILMSRQPQIFYNLRNSNVIWFSFLPRFSLVDSQNKIMAAILQYKWSRSIGQVNISLPNQHWFCIISRAHQRHQPRINWHYLAVSDIWQRFRNI